MNLQGSGEIPPKVAFGNSKECLGVNESKKIQIKVSLLSCK
jgi:hypothetical protein